ncbi:MAG: chromate efflux transporter [Verrucomicrobiota bacterium]
MIEVFLTFLRLGFTSFGGPIAHLGYFRDLFVREKKWLGEEEYADLVALCQFLPGPASSQVGLAVGALRAGLPGAAAAWIGFTMPSTIALILFALGLRNLDPGSDLSALQGLKILAVFVVAQAVTGMGRALCPDWPRASLAAATAILILWFPGNLIQLGCIGGGALIGLLAFQPSPASSGTPDGFRISRRTGAVFLTLFFIGLFGLPWLARLDPGGPLDLLGRFYRPGSLVFGGGHVVLPLLRAELPVEWLDQDTFMAGYGAAQAVPGPLFTFSAFLGTVLKSGPGGWTGGMLCLFGIFLPSFLLIPGILPFWNDLKKIARIRKALVGVNAVVVGLLLAALYDPVWTSAIGNHKDLTLLLILALASHFWKWPLWSLVLLAGGLGWAML